MATPAAAMLIVTLRPPSSNPQTAPVSRLIHVQPSGSSEQPALLALGGQVVGAPPELWAFTSLQVQPAQHTGYTPGRFQLLMSDEAWTGAHCVSSTSSCQLAMAACGISRDFRLLQPFR